MVADGEEEGLVVSPAIGCNVVGFVILLAIEMDGEDFDLPEVVIVVMVLFKLSGVPGIDGNAGVGRQALGFLDGTTLP